MSGEAGWLRRTVERASQRAHCAHGGLRPIYGDEINHVGGWRLQCRTCGRFLHGPVSLAKSRAAEAATAGGER